jgi:hypothetical protein
VFNVPADGIGAVILLDKELHKVESLMNAAIRADYLGLMSLSANFVKKGS